MIYQLFRLWAVLAIFGILLAGCDSPTESSPAAAQPAETDRNYKPLADKVLIQGRVTFDQIPRDAKTGRLLPSASFPTPVRSAQVDAVSTTGDVLFSTVTSQTGEYTVLVPAQIELYIRVWAKIEDTVNASWQAQVVDNLNNNATYALKSADINSLSSNHQLNIHAASGLKKDNVSDARASAPFAILDTLHDGFDFIAQQDQRHLKPLTVAWSTRNSTAVGDTSTGAINTSFYSTQDGTPKIYLLGAIENDADDYDRSVILHEFGHYLMDQLSRSDSVGGSHDSNNKLDLRVAFNEAICNVLSALIDGQPIYYDSRGDQLPVQRFDLERHDSHINGWYNTEALSWLIYDMIDDPPVDDDGLSLGWDGLYAMLTNPEIIFFDGAMSIFPFLTVAQDLFSDDSQEIQALAMRHGISYSDPYGGDETDGGGSAITLPLYHFYEEGSSTQICSDKEFSDFNGVDVHRFVRFDINTPGSYTITAQKIAGALTVANPEFVVYQNGRVKLAGFSSAKNTESISHVLSNGHYLLDIFERSNADNENDNGGLACFELTITLGERQNAPINPDCDNLAAIAGDSRCQLPASSGSINNAVAL